MLNQFDDFLRPTIWRKIVGFVRRARWRYRDWRHPPQPLYAVGDAVMVGDAPATVVKVIDRCTFELDSGTVVTVYDPRQ